MADIQKTIELLFSAKATGAQAAIADLQKSVDGLGNEASQTAPKLDDMADAAENIGDKTEKIDGMVTAFKTLAASIVVKEFIDANVNAEQFLLTMTQLTGSSEEAADEFDYVKDLAKTLGLELWSTADAYAGLTAATKGTGLEGAATKEIFEAVASSMAVLGKSSADTEGALLAISQMVSKGTVSMEELRGQLGERLPGAFKVAADAMGVTTSQLVDMVSKGDLAADVFLPKFADALKATYGGVTEVDTFQAAWNNLMTSIEEAFVFLGESGAIDIATKGIEGMTLSVVGTIATFDLLGGTLANMAYTLVSLDFEGYQERQQALVAEFDKTVAGARDRFLGLNDELKKVEASGDAVGKAITTAMKDGALSAEDMKKAAKEVDAIMKEMGLDPKQFTDPIDETVEHMVSQFEKLASNPAANGSQILAGLLVSLDKLKGDDGIVEFTGAIDKAFAEGKLSAEQYADAVNALETKQAGLWGAMVKTTESSKDQADAMAKQEAETKKAEEAANKMALELEKLDQAMAEAVLEAKVSLDIAEMETNAEVAASILDTLASNYASATSLIGDLLTSLSESGNTAADKIKIDLAKDFADQAAEMHKAELAMLAAQTAYYEQKVALIAKGDPIVTINGAGLEPALQFIMWEVLKHIQVTMAADGGDMLVGGIG